jgi:hypothetical protein
LRKSAREALEKADTNVPEEILEHLDEVAQDAKKVLDDLGGTIISSNLLKKKLSNLIAKYQKIGLKITTEEINSNHRLMKEWIENRRWGQLQTSHKNFKVNFRYREDCSLLTFQHEVWHLEDYVSLGIKRYSEINQKTPWLHEKAVFERILATKARWTELELIDSYLYYKKYSRDEGGIEIFIEEMENLCKKLNIK